MKWNSDFAKILPKKSGWWLKREIIWDDSFSGSSFRKKVTFLRPEKIGAGAGRTEFLFFWTFSNFFSENFRTFLCFGYFFVRVKSICPKKNLDQDDRCRFDWKSVFMLGQKFHAWFFFHFLFFLLLRQNLKKSTNGTFGWSLESTNNDHLFFLFGKIEGNN